MNWSLARLLLRGSIDNSSAGEPSFNQLKALELRTNYGAVLMKIYLTMYIYQWYTLSYRILSAFNTRDFL